MPAAPVAYNDGLFSVVHGQALNVSAANGVLANDTDADNDTLSATIVTYPSHGYYAFASDGSFSYVPSFTYVGSDSFTYKANDGTSDSNTATVSLSSTNIAPTIGSSQSFSVASGQQITGIDFTAGAGDADGDELIVIVYGAPGHGYLAEDPGGTWYYLAPTDWTGTESYTFWVSDGVADSSPRSVEFTVSMPVVSISSVPYDEATEGEEENGEFVVSRTGPTGAALTVGLEFSGTATMEGTSLTSVGDYGLLVDDIYLVSSVIFEPGQSSVTVTLAAYEEGEVDGDEQAIIVLADSTNYTYELATNKTATITTTDNSGWDASAKPKHVPILLEPKLRISLRDNTSMNKVLSTLTLTAGHEYVIAAFGAGKIGTGAQDDADAEYAKYGTGTAYSYLRAGNETSTTGGAGWTDVGLKIDNGWGTPTWTQYQSNHRYRKYWEIAPGSGNRQLGFYYQDVPGQYEDNSGTLTVEIGQRKPFGTMPEPAANPPIPETGTNLTVVIVTSTPAERTEWADTAREHFGQNAYIYNTIVNLQDLSDKLADFPNGSIGKLVFGGHGSEGDVGIQISNSVTTFDPDAELYGVAEELNYTTLTDAYSNRNTLFNSIRDKLKAGATLDCVGCGDASQMRLFNGGAFPYLMEADVLFAVGQTRGWYTLVGDAYWVNEPYI